MHIFFLNDTCYVLATREISSTSNLVAKVFDQQLYELIKIIKSTSYARSDLFTLLFCFKLSTGSNGLGLILL